MWITRSSWLLPCLLAGLSVAASSCNKADEPAGKAEQNESKEPAPEQKPDPVAPEPEANRPADPLQLGEEPTVVFGPDGGLEAPLHWKVGESVVAISAAPAQDLDGKGPSLSILASIDEAQPAAVASCAMPDAAAKGFVDIMKRGDSIHIRCVTPPAGEATGDTKAVRLSFDTATKSLKESGSYEGEGIVDPDTIDLDEGE